MNKKIVGVLFGGMSEEHDVSIRSAQNVVKNIDRGKYEVKLIFIDRSGRFFFVGDDFNEVDFFEFDSSFFQEVVFLTGSGGVVFDIEEGADLFKVDVVFPVLHGPFGEDGTVQGMLELVGVPFVGSGVVGCAVGMDKDIAKRLLRDADIRNSNFIVVRVGDEIVFGDVIDKLGVPLFVKPANMGSSVGISKVSSEDEFIEALNEAFKFDEKVIVEEFIDGREVECAVMEDFDGKVVASSVGEIVVKKDFYSYDAKYVDDDGAELVIPAKLDESVVKKIQELVVKVFVVLEGRGFSRVDFFVRNGDGEVFVNEINSIPGFTEISMFPKLFEFDGFSYEEIVGGLIEGAL